MVRWCRAGANRATRARRHSAQAQTTQLALCSAVHGMHGPVRPHEHEHDHTELPSPLLYCASKRYAMCVKNPAGARRRRRSPGFTRLERTYRTTA